MFTSIVIDSSHGSHDGIVGGMFINGERERRVREERCVIIDVSDSNGCGGSSS